MTDSITFISIIDPVKFLKIQNQFISNDIYLNNPENYFTKCNKTDFGLNVSKLYSSKDKKPEPDFFFFKHYLNNEIQSLAENFIDAYTKELNKLELNNGNINLYYSQTIETLLKYEKIIEITNHLIEEIKKRVQEKIAVCIDRIQEINTAKKIHLGNKISFKLIRQDVLVLFYLLREKEIIKWHTNNELKVLIENNFMSYDFKSKKHLILNIKRNDFTEIRSGRKTINKSLSRLKDIFKNENFFDII